MVDVKSESEHMDNWKGKWKWAHEKIEMKSESEHMNNWNESE